MAVLLFVLTSFSFIQNLRSVRAESVPVAITSPSADQQLTQGAVQITGTAPALKNIIVYDGASKIGGTTSNAGGTWAVSWNNQQAGHHTLRALMVTGSTYKAAMIGRDSVQASDANTGQVTQNYPAGFSHTIGMAYDTSLDKILVINEYSGTVTVLDGTTQNVQTTVTFSTEFGAASQVTGYTFDQTHHRLYILREKALSIIDTQSNTLVANINYASARIVQEQTYFQEIRYDQEGRYVYFYNRLQTYPENSTNSRFSVQVQRIDLQSNSMDTWWNSNYGLIDGMLDILPGSNQKVYIVKTDSVSVYNNQDNSLSQINFDFSQCSNYPGGQTFHAEAAAMSMDFKKLYFVCAKEDESPPMIAYNTETETTIGSFDLYQGFNTGNGIGGGQLTQHYYVQLAFYSDRLEVYDTDTDTALPEITGLNAINGDTYASERPMAVVSGNDSLYILTRNQNTSDSSLYKVDPSTGGIVAQHTYAPQDNPLSFYGDGSTMAKSSGNNDNVLATTVINQLYELNPVAGTSKVTGYGMNSAASIYHSKTNNRVFSTPTSLDGDSSFVAVGNTLTGEYESSILLPNFLPFYSHMDETGSTLYFFGIAFVPGNPGQYVTRVYAIDTLTLSISHVYTSMGIQPNNGQEQYDLFTASLTGHGNELILATCGKIYKLNLTNDQTQTASTSHTSCLANTGLPITSALNSAGTRLAVVSDWGTVDIYDTSTLSLVRTIERESTPISDGFRDIRFNSADDIIVSSAGITPRLFKYKLSDGSLSTTIPLENHCSDANNMRFISFADTSSSDYLQASLTCINPSTFGGGSLGDAETSTSVVDTNLGIEVTNRQTESSPGAAYLAIRSYGVEATDINVSTDTRSVLTLGESLVITSPSNNAHLDKGTHTITGSATPNATINITVDSTTIGTTQSNEFGAWEYEYNFATAGTRQIQATQYNGSLVSDTHTIQINEPTPNPPPIVYPPPPVTPGVTIPPKPIVPATLRQPVPPAKTLTKKVPLQKSERKLTQQAAVTKSVFGVKRFTKMIPRPLLDGIPYALMLVLITQAGYYLFQSQKQLQMENRLKEIYEKQDVLNGERRNFLEVTSHYLRTPLTYIKAGTEMLVKEQPGNQKSHELNESVAHLSLFIESLVEESNNTSELDKIKEPPKIKSALLSKYFLIPLVGLVTTIGLFYLIFGVIGGIHYSTATYITQGLIAFLLVQLFYGAYKNSQRIKIEKAHTEDLIKAEEAFDHTRSRLIADAGEQLDTRTGQIATILSGLGDSNASNQRIIAQGIERLRDLSKSFLLVSQLEASNLSNTTTSIHARDFIAKIVKSFEEDLKAKNLRIEIVGLEGDPTFSSDQSLAELALRSLIQNAIQVSTENSIITVKCSYNAKHLAFHVIDQGEGIPKEKIDQLFEPFIKVGPVTTFNHEGIGLSLYLDRLIMHGLGGDIDIASQLKQGTTATLSFNTL